MESAKSLSIFLTGVKTMRCKSFFILLSLLILTSFATNLAAQETKLNLKDQYLPSEANALMQELNNEYFEKVGRGFKVRAGKNSEEYSLKSRELAAQLSPKIIQTGLSVDEQWELYVINRSLKMEIDNVTILKNAVYSGKQYAKEALNDYFTAILDTLDSAGHLAELNKVRKVIGKDEGFYYFMTAVQGQMLKYAEQGKLKEAADFLRNEIKLMGTEIPYYVTSFPASYVDLFINVYGKAETRKYLDSLMTNAKAGLAKYEADVASGKKLAPTLKQKWDGVIRYLQGGDKLFDQLGKPIATPIFDKTFNTKATKFDDFKGKVIMLDFWANWCQPCKDAFPHLREIYNNHKAQGFEVIGITTYQTYFSDNNIREQKLTPERELELTAELIKRHKMTWPVTFLEKTHYKDYGVTAIPAFFLLDKQGNLVMRVTGNTRLNMVLFEQKLKELLAN
jgi:thiol-disulfide isomerase/thioredoxin